MLFDEIASPSETALERFGEMDVRVLVEQVCPSEHATRFRERPRENDELLQCLQALEGALQRNEPRGVKTRTS